METDCDLKSLNAISVLIKCIKNSPKGAENNMDPIFHPSRDHNRVVRLLEITVHFWIPQLEKGAGLHPKKGVNVQEIAVHSWTRKYHTVNM